MAKKKTAAKSKKKTTRSKAASKKKTTAASARSKPAASKKKAAKKTTRKTAAKRPTSKKKVARKAAAKKKATTKKAVTRKKAVTKKKAASKKTTKKTARKTTSKKATSKKASIKKAPKKKAAAKKAAAKPAAKPKKKATPKPKAKDERYTLTEARAAASGLAARAGLRMPRAQGPTETTEKAKVRKLKKSPLTKAQLEKYREILFQKRAEVAGDVSAMESEAFGPSDGGAFPQHQADQGSDEYEQSLSLGLAESQRKLLTEINEALARINDGTYGICALTGGPIGKNRLDATPWTKLSLEGAREQDRQNYYQ